MNVMPLMPIIMTGQSGQTKSIQQTAQNRKTGFGDVVGISINTERAHNLLINQLTKAFERCNISFADTITHIDLIKEGEKMFMRIFTYKRNVRENNDAFVKKLMTERNICCFEITEADMGNKIIKTSAGWKQKP